MNWKKVAKYCENVYRLKIDWDNDSFICPECGSTISKEKYAGNKFLKDGMCPVCEIPLVNK